METMTTKAGIKIPSFYEGFIGERWVKSLFSTKRMCNECTKPCSKYVNEIPTCNEHYRKVCLDVVYGIKYHV